MKYKLLRFSLLSILSMLWGTMGAADFGVDLRDAKGGIITAEEAGASTTITFGLSVAADGTVSRVAADAANAAAVITGKTGNNHGLQSFAATVPVEGPVKITMSTCSWGGDVTITNAEGATITSFSTKKGEGGSGCYKGNGDNDENVISATYAGEATTLTISGGAYVGWFSVKAVDATACNITFSKGDVECQGDVPTGGQYASGDKFTIPAQNFTLYKEGYTLTGWTDGENTYDAGSEITLPKGDLTLTPVFTQNEVSLSDRTEPVTLKWNFRRDQGAPVLNYQNKAGILVAQATIGGKTIDVAMPFTTSDGGKLNNTNNTDCAQCNNNTTFTIPSCKNAVVTMESYGGSYIFKADGKTATTVDGQSDYEAGQTLNYTIANSAETINIVMGNDAGYVRFVQVVLPVVQQAGGQKFDNVDVLVRWPFTDTKNINESTVTPDGAFSVVSVDPGDLTITGSAIRTSEPKLDDVTFVKFKPAGSTTQLHWYVKPAKGLTFTPSEIRMYIQRFGTDAKSGVTISAKVEGAEAVTLGTFTARRNNFDDAAEIKKWGSLPDDIANEAVVTLTEAQQQQLASGEGLHIYATIGVGNTKEGGFADIRLAGKINGTAQDVELYTLAIAANPTEAGNVSVYPKADEYEAESEVTLTATENFSYDFVNWTNAAGEEVSAEAKFKYTVNANETLTANFKKVNTYELALTVDGTSDYMVTVQPAPTEVDGKWMYEEGQTVVLTANQYEGLVTFTNWSDGTTNSELSVKMDGDKQITASYTEADIIAGWDFYKAGNNGRKADFAAADNDADALNLVNESGDVKGWLDKSTLAGGGYESFKGAAVNWNTGSKEGDVGNYYWQTKVNAEAFTDVNVQFQMLYNYNAYQTYDVDYSLNGTDWTNVGNITMTGAKQVAKFNKTLPEAANNQKELYIRMKADKTSTVDGASSKNDGNTLAMFFITGTPKLVDDPVAPAIVLTVPADNATGASASGKIVLNFDKKVQVVEGTKATLGTMELTPVVSGKVITFEYKGLEYATEYTFSLPANTVQNLTGATLADAITIKFTTMARPTVEKKLYDAVVSTADELVEAIDNAGKRADKNVRYRIFVKNGEYTIPLKSTTKTVNSYTVPECITFINSNNISFIGESRDGVIITNGINKSETFAGQYGTTSKYDGIGNSDVFQSSGSGLYWQDLTVETGMDDATGRDLAIQDRGTKTIYKNVGLRGYQDTWTSNNDNGLYYFEGGYLRGRTDYMCGKGDAYFNGVELRQIAGGYAAVPSKPANIGWVYKDCVINGEAAVVNYATQEKKTAADADGNYTLGRPWGSGTPMAVFIDTKMNVVPSGIGWSEMSGGWPARFAEYNSTTSTGSVIDLKGRKTTFAETHENNPVLTAVEAAEYSDMSKMFGDWQPQLATEQAPIPQNVQIEVSTLTWDDSNYALLYAICKDGKVIDFTTEATYTVDDANATYTVRAANEMGGLSEASAAATVVTGIENVTKADAINANTDAIYTIQGVRVDKARKGLYIINGKKVIVK